MYSCTNCEISSTEIDTDIADVTVAPNEKRPRLRMDFFDRNFFPRKNIHHDTKRTN